MDRTLVTLYHKKLRDLIKVREDHFLFAVDQANAMSHDHQEVLAVGTALEDTNNKIQELLEESLEDLYFYLKTTHVILTARDRVAAAAGNPAKQAKHKKVMQDARVALSKRFG